MRPLFILIKDSGATVMAGDREVPGCPGEELHRVAASEPGPFRAAQLAVAAAQAARRSARLGLHPASSELERYFAQEIAAERAHSTLVTQLVEEGWKYVPASIRGKAHLERAGGQKLHGLSQAVLEAMRKRQGWPT